MSTQIALYDTFAYGVISSEDVKTIHETIAKDCNEAQFRLFMGIAKSIDANPLLGEIHPSVYQGKLTPQYGIDLYVRKAKEADGYKGYDVQLVHEQDEFKMHQERAEDGRYFVVIDEHSWSFPRGKVIGGYAFAYKEGLMPFSVLMEVLEVEHYQRSAIGMQKTMWTNNFNDMFKKHMVKRALKAAFGLRFTDEDVDGKAGVGDSIPPYDPNQRKDITDEADKMAAQQGQQAPQQQEQPGDESQNAVDQQYEAAKNAMREKYKALGLTTKPQREEWITKKKIKWKGDQPTLVELQAVLKIMDADIADLRAAEAELDDLDPLAE